MWFSSLTINTEFIFFAKNRVCVSHCVLLRLLSLASPCLHLRHCQSLLQYVSDICKLSRGVSHYLQEKETQAGNNLTDCSQLCLSSSIRIVCTSNANLCWTLAHSISHLFFYILVKRFFPLKELDVHMMRWNIVQNGKLQEWRRSAGGERLS